MKIDVQSFMLKKVFYTLIALFFISVTYKGQRHEVGVQLGMSNLVGDIGRTNYILQKPTRNFTDYGIPFYGSVLYRMNFNPYQTVRLNLAYNHIQFLDGAAKEKYNSYIITTILNSLILTAKKGMIFYSKKPIPICCRWKWIFTG